MYIISQYIQCFYQNKQDYHSMRSCHFASDLPGRGTYHTPGSQGPGGHRTHEVLSAGVHQVGLKEKVDQGKVKSGHAVQ
jgi:hypothetical protein